MNKRNVLYLVSTLKKSGPLNILLGIVGGLNKEKFNITILSLSKENTDSLYQAFKELECEIICLNHSRIKGLFKNKEKTDSMEDSLIVPDEN